MSRDTLHSAIIFLGYLLVDSILLTLFVALLWIGDWFIKAFGNGALL